MQVKIISNSKEWNAWLEENIDTPPFTQSWEWGEILISEGKKVFRLAVEDGGEICCQAQIVENGLGFFKYGFCPKGPVFLKTLTKKKEAFNLICDFLKKQNEILVRMEPASEMFLKERLIKSIDINPRATSILDLALSEENLLSRMHPKTRYNIHLAEKKELGIKDEKNFEVFWELMKKTGERDDFRLHDDRHYKAILNSPPCRQLTAYFKNMPVAVVVLFGFGNTMTYLFGASDYQHRKLMAPHLLQWEGIKLAKNSGYKFYDFFGIAPRKGVRSKEKGISVNDRPTMGELSEHRNDVGKREIPPDLVGTQDDKVAVEYAYDEEHQYAGVTRFKLGFGGEVKEMPGTFDLIISTGKYKMYQTLRKIRRLF